MLSHHEGEQDREWSRLMAAAQDGDRACYERLLREILPLLRSIAGRWHRPDRAEDVVQDILLTIHRVRHRYLYFLQNICIRGDRYWVFIH